jgi:F0F1-type ATP synthase assembly protein I
VVNRTVPVSATQRTQENTREHKRTQENTREQNRKGENKSEYKRTKENRSEQQNHQAVLESCDTTTAVIVPLSIQIFK